MFKRISAVVMVAVMSAMLSLTAFAEVDREAVEKKLIEYFYEDDWASITRNADGDHIPIEDNPNASLYYNIYIRSFIDESSDERLENLDLTDETNNSGNYSVPIANEKGLPQTAARTAEKEFKPCLRAVPM